MDVEGIVIKKKKKKEEKDREKSGIEKKADGWIKFFLL